MKQLIVNVSLYTSTQGLFRVETSAIGVGMQSHSLVKILL